MTGIRKAAPRYTFTRVYYICVRMNDHTGIAAEFERDAFASGAILKCLANGRTACERQKFYSIIFNERRSILRRTRHDAECAFRPSRF